MSNSLNEYELPYIVAVDFDNTLCYSNYPDCGEPNMDIIDLVRFHKKRGDYVILWTTREGEPLLRAVEWCKKYEIEFDRINDNHPNVIAAWNENPRKVFADLYIDDRSFVPETFSFVVNDIRKKKLKGV